MINNGVNLVTKANLSVTEKKISWSGSIVSLIMPGSEGLVCQDVGILHRDTSVSLAWKGNSLLIIISIWQIKTPIAVYITAIILEYGKKDLYSPYYIRH